MPIEGPHHVAIAVRDLAQSLRFYRDILGLAVLRHWTLSDGSPRSVWLAIDANCFLALERVGGSTARSDEDPGLHCLSLRIARGERAAWIARLAAGSHAVERESPYTIYVRDPDGVLIGLSHYPVSVDDPEGAPPRASGA